MFLRFLRNTVSWALFYLFLFGIVLGMVFLYKGNTGWGWTYFIVGIVGACFSGAYLLLEQEGIFDEKDDDEY